jgi:hypothetical protein
MLWTTPWPPICPFACLIFVPAPVSWASYIKSPFHQEEARFLCDIFGRMVGTRGFGPPSSPANIYWVRADLNLHLFCTKSLLFVRALEKSHSFFESILPILVQIYNLTVQVLNKILELYFLSGHLLKLAGKFAPGFSKGVCHIINMNPFLFRLAVHQQKLRPMKFTTRSKRDYGNNEKVID